MSDDSELLRLSLAGDRDAFGRIVERYQSMVAAVCYCRTGDLASSEDLAQETFLAAWKNLASLREPDKLAAWLCGIARNTRLSARRDAARAAPPSVSMDSAAESASPVPTSLEHAISREDEATLRNALENLPPDYREPLVLFYREGESVSSVASALGLSEDAAKQRLARGRAMLRKEFAAFVGPALRRTAPKAAFTIAVIAALPALAPSVASAATAATVTGASVAQTAAGGASGARHLLHTLLDFFVWLGVPILAAQDIIRSKSPRERRYVAKYWLAVMGVLAAAIGALVVAINLITWRFGMSPTLFAAVLVAWFLAGSVTLLIFSIRKKRRRAAIRMEDGTGAPGVPQSAAHPWLFYGGLAFVAYGFVSWVFVAAWLMGDAVAAGLAFFIASIMFLAASRRFKRGDGVWASVRFLVEMMSFGNIIILFRLWDRWAAVLEKSSVHPVSPWTVAAITVGILAATEILTRLKERAELST